MRKRERPERQQERRTAHLCLVKRLGVLPERIQIPQNQVRQPLITITVEFVLPAVLSLALALDEAVVQAVCAAISAVPHAGCSREEISIREGLGTGWRDAPAVQSARKRGWGGRGELTMMRALGSEGEAVGLEGGAERVRIERVSQVVIVQQHAERVEQIVRKRSRTQKGAITSFSTAGPASFLALSGCAARFRGSVRCSASSDDENPIQPSGFLHSRCSKERRGEDLHKELTRLERYRYRWTGGDCSGRSVTKHFISSCSADL